MLRRRSKEGPVEHGSLEPHLDVTLPGEAQASVSLHGIARNLHETIRHMGFGRRRNMLCLILFVILRVGRKPVETATGFDVESHRGQLVLQGLEVPDGDAELLSGLGILDTHLKQPLGSPESIGRAKNETDIPKPMGRALSIRQQLTGRILEGDAAHTASTIRAIHGFEFDSLRPSLHQPQASA